MRTWTVDATTRGGSVVADAASRLIGVLGAPSFDDTLLDAVNAIVDADALCAYRLSREGPPRKYCAANRGKSNSTDPCWQLYRSGIYRSDETFEEAYELVQTSAFAIGHLTAQEVRSDQHRQCIYDRHGLLDRLSVSSPEPNGDLLALNIYRRRDAGHFKDRDMARFEDVSTILVAAVRRHALLAPNHAPDAAASTADRIARYERMLERDKPSLTARERSICARLLAGMLYDGIAADLGIGVTTVKTYRQRAFDRLGIHFRSELLGIALDAQRASEV